MPTIEKTREHKELFRIWYECLQRTCKFWDAYHVLIKTRIARESNTKPSSKQYFNEVSPPSVTSAEDLKEFIGNFFEFFANVGIFTYAIDADFDAVWEEMSAPGSISCSTLYEDIEDMKLVLLDSIKYKIDDFTKFTSIKDGMTETDNLKYLKNIKTVPSNLGDDWRVISEFDIAHTDLQRFIQSLYVFDKNSMRINLSIYPFGKTKKQLLEEIWYKIKKFSSDKKKQSRHLYTYARWMGPYSKHKVSETKRYLGVFDLRAMNKGNKAILKEEYDVNENEFIKEVSTFYRPRVHNKDPSSEALRMIARDYRKAKEMIKNAQEGYFPKYAQ